MLKKIANISRIILGLFFVSYSLFKALDPLGTSYALSNTLEIVFNKAFTKAALGLTVLLITIEFTLGVMLLAKFVIHYTASWTTILLAIYSLVMLKVVTSGQIMVCDCISDYFFNNSKRLLLQSVLLFILSLPLFFKRFEFQNKLLPEKRQLSWILTASLFIISIQFINYTFLPVIDFSPFKTGVNLEQKLHKTLEERRQEYFSAVYKDEKGALILTDKPDTVSESGQWKLVGVSTKPKSKIHKANICNFKIINQFGKDLTDSILSLKQPVLLIIAYDLDRTNLKGFTKTLEFARQFTEKYYPVAYCLTSSPQSKIDSLTELTGAYDLEFCHADQNILKMMIRANPGILVLKDGYIITKRNYNTLPNLSKKEFNTDIKRIKHE